MRRSEWRDCLAWKNEGFAFSTSNNQSCKLYDAALTQYIGLYDDPTLNGLQETMRIMFENEPDFVMGRVFTVGIQAVISPDTIAKFKNEFKDLNRAKLTASELDHVDAINFVFKGDLIQACRKWEDILIDNPNDLLAVKLLYDIYFHLGDYRLERKNMVASVLPFWSAKHPLYEYVYGLYSFALAEVNLLKEAEEYGKKSLFINPYDAWAVHSVSHVYDYRNDTSEGIKFLNETARYWSNSFLSHHNYWHLALHNLELGDFDRVLQIFDENVFPKTKQLQTSFSIVDATSLLYRLKLQCSLLSENERFKSELSERFKELGELCRLNVGKYSHGFTNVHLMMGVSALDAPEAQQEFFNAADLFYKSLDEGETTSHFRKINTAIGLSLQKAIVHFDRQEYAQVVHLLHPIRYEIDQIGGSNAQQDIFHQILTFSALHSNETRHNRIGIRLLNEREALKPNSNLNKRLAFNQ